VPDGGPWDVRTREGGCDQLVPVRIYYCAFSEVVKIK
jgi:hypothetical protein